MRIYELINKNRYTFENDVWYVEEVDLEVQEGKTMVRKETFRR